MTTVPADFLSCDWGTSSFRLRWVAGASGQVVREVRGSTGVRTLYDEAMRTGAATEAARGEVFARFLFQQLIEILAGQAPPARALPLVISGMASSTIGWRELPYARLPFRLDGRDLQSVEISWNAPAWIGPTHLISGLASAIDVMRGEEVEIVGLCASPGRDAWRQRSLLILPGTHSKHVWIDDGAVVDFRTFMTGELFEVLGRHSILRASVDLDPDGGGNEMFEADRAAFQDGVCWAVERGLSGGLFRVRTRAVLDRVASRVNSRFLSGLLIGAELAGLGSLPSDRKIILGAAGQLSDLYGLALASVLGPGREWIQVPPAEAGSASIAAHAVFLKNRTGGGLE